MYIAPIGLKISNKMKVLFCSPYLQEEGIHKGGINIWANNILTYYQSLSDAQIEITPISFDRKHFINASTGVIKRAYLGVKELSVAVAEVKRELKRQRYDVVHICTSASMSLVKDLKLLRLAKRYGAKSVIHLHFGRTPELVKRNNWEWKLLKKVIKKTDLVVSMDMFTYKVLSELNYNNVMYCPNPLSKAIMNQIDKDKGLVQRQRNKLLFVGHVLPTKGVYELVEACKRIEDVELHIVGKAEPQIIADLQNIASYQSRGSWLYLRGEISHDDVLRELMSATLFVFPSYTEGFPNVILEAMACKCPIASSGVGAIPIMLDVDNDPCGICYPPQSVESVYNAIITLLNNYNLREEYANKAYQRVYREYAIQEVWDKLANIWKRV